MRRDEVTLLDIAQAAEEIAATEETFEEIAADEALWDAQFAATDNGKLAALVAAVEAEINEGKTLPMFDEHGEFIEHLPLGESLFVWERR